MLVTIYSVEATPEATYGTYTVRVDADFPEAYLRRGVYGPDDLNDAIERLIAAAPLMLDALEGAEIYLAKMVEDHANGFGATALEDVRTALRAAREGL
jgi:hypothetical protein